MEAGGVHRQLQAIMNPRAQCRVDRRDESGVADPRVEQDLRTELFDDLDLDVEAQVGRVCRTGDMDVLGTNADRGLAAVTAVDAMGDRLRQADAKSRRLGPYLAIAGGERDFGEVHRRRADEARHEAV